MKRIAVVVSVCAAAVLPMVATWWLAGPVVDDAAISIAYGWSFWEGFGFRLTHDSPVVEGFTSPLWALWTGLGTRVGFEPLAFAHWSGAACASLGVLVLGFGIRRVSLHPLVFVPLWLTCAFPSLTFWLGSGMETGLQLLTLAVTFVVASTRRHPLLAGLFFGSLLMVRPEFIVIGALALGVKTLAQLREGGWRFHLAAWLGFVAAVGGFFLFRLAVFAELLPNTWWAKRNWDFNGLAYLGNFIAMHAWVLGAFVLGSIAAWCSRRRFETVMLAAIVASVVLFGWVSKGDWMREWRFLVFVMPFLLAPMSVALTVVLTQRTVLARARRLTVWAFALLAFGAASFGAYEQRDRHAQLKAAPEFPATFVMGNAQALKRSLEALEVRHAQVGLPDVGGLGLVFRSGNVTDVASLADHALAHAEGFPAMEDYLLNEGPPLVMDAHGPSGHVAFPKLRDAFFPGWHGGTATMAGLTKTEDPRCPGAKVRLLAADSAEVQRVALRALLEAGEAVKALRYWRCVESYVPLNERLSRGERRDFADAALQRAKGEGDREKALRLHSFAAVITGDAWLRRRTDQLRAEVFPPPSK